MANSVQKYRIGYLDEESQWVERFKLRLKGSFDIYIFQIDGNTTINDIIAKVKEEELDCLITDFELKEADIIQFNGDEVIDALREKYPYFPVFIITGKEEGDVLGQVEDNDIVRLKDELDSKTDILIQRIENKIASYYSQIYDAEKTVERLIDKKHSEGLSIPEEELLTEKYLYLEKIDPDEKLLPDNLIQPESITKLNEFASEARLILEELKKLNNNASV